MPWKWACCVSFCPKQRPNSKADSRLSRYFIWWIRCCVLLFFVKKNKAAAVSTAIRPSKRSVNRFFFDKWKSVSGNETWQSRHKHRSVLGKGCVQAMHKRGKKRAIKSAQNCKCRFWVFKVQTIYWWIVNVLTTDQQMYRYLFEKVKDFFN